MVKVGIKVYIPHLKHLVKPYSVIAHRNPFFDLFQQMIYVVAQVNSIMLIVVVKVF